MSKDLKKKVKDLCLGRSLILAQSAQSAQSAQFYFLTADLNYKSVKKKFKHFNTLKYLIFNSLVKKLEKYCYFDKNVKFLCNFFRKINSCINLKNIFEKLKMN